MKWTTEAPTEPGWYWWRAYTHRGNAMTPYPVRLTPRNIGDLEVSYNGIFETLESMAKSGGEYWPEKIEPPEDKP